MAYGLKTAENSHSAPVKSRTGAQLAQIGNEEAGSHLLEPLISKNGRNALRQLAVLTGARLAQLAQQGGRCASRRDTPKGVFPSDNWRSPQVRLLNWRTGLPAIHLNAERPA